MVSLGKRKQGQKKTDDSKEKEEWKEGMGREGGKKGNRSEITRSGMGERQTDNPLSSSLIDEFIILI